MPRVRLTGYQCERCEHTWLPRSGAREPKVCPRCKSPYWNTPRQDATKGRTPVAEPCVLLDAKLAEHNTMTQCPYCSSLFDVHVGMIYLEKKQASTAPKDTHLFFDQVMSDA